MNGSGEVTLGGDTIFFLKNEASGKQTSSVEKCRFSPPRTARTLLPTPTERQSWASQLAEERKASRSANPGSVHNTEEAQVPTRQGHEPRRLSK